VRGTMAVTAKLRSRRRSARRALNAVASCSRGVPSLGNAVC
jgi:hypothetical protein